MFFPLVNFLFPSLTLEATVGSNSKNLQSNFLHPTHTHRAFQVLRVDSKIGCPSELTNADDLVKKANIVEDLKKKFQFWKQNLESKGLSVNLVMTEVFVSRKVDRTLKLTGKGHAQYEEEK